MRKAILLLILTLVVNSFIYSDNSSDNNYNAEYSPMPDFMLSILGDHSFKFIIPAAKDHMDFYGYEKSPKFKNNFSIELSYKTLKVVSEFELDLVINEWANMNAAWENMTYKAGILNFRPGENKIVYSPWKFNFSAGFQNFTWGAADGLNPTDYLNPRDYSRSIEPEKIPVFSGYIGFFPADFISLEYVYIPFEQNDIFPEDIVERIPKDIFFGQALNTSTFTFEPVYHSKDATYKNLNFDPRSFVMAGKLNFYTQYTDFSFSYCYNIDTYYTPEINLAREKIENTPFGPVPELYLSRVSSMEFARKRLHQIGTDFKVNAGIFGIWAELCYTITEDYLMNDFKLRNHKFEWVGGFDFSFGPGDKFYFNFQYMGELNINYDKDFYNDYEDGKPDKNYVDNKDYMEEYYYRAFTNFMSFTNEGLFQGWYLNMEFRDLGPNPYFTPSFTIAYFLPLLYDYNYEKRYGGILIKPELEIKPLDAFSIIIGARLAYSFYTQHGESYVDIKELDKIGRFYNTNNVYIVFKYSWSYEFQK